MHIGRNCYSYEDKITTEGNFDMEKLIEILKETRPEFDFENASDFIENGMLDSFDIVVLVSELDSAYSISIDGSDILPENFNSLEAMANLVRKSGGTI